MEGGCFVVGSKAAAFSQRHPTLLKPCIQAVCFLAKGKQVGYNVPRAGRSSARLERTVRVREAPGSNPGAPTEEKL